VHNRPMEWNKKPSAFVYWLSVIYILYLLALPVLANFTIVPLLGESALSIVCWFYFGLFGITLAYGGMFSFYPFPRDPASALMRTLFLPISAGLWWLWNQEVAPIEYFAIMLIFETLAMYLSIFLMSFIPMRFYNPDHPKAKGIGNYFFTLIIEGGIFAGGFIAALAVVIWPWVTNDALWQHPVTWLLLLIAAIEHIVANFKWHRTTYEISFSIEPVLLFTSIPWGISWFLIA